MSQAYQAIPASAKIDIPASIPSGMLYRIKEIQGCNREQVKMVAISGQGSVRGGQKIIVQLPPNSLVDLSTFECNFNGVCDHGGNTDGNGISKFVQARYFPRNTASLIDALDIKLNGSTKQRIDQYNYIYNILHDFNAGDDSLRKNAIGTNATPNCKFWNWNGKTKRKNMYPMGHVSYPASYGDADYYSIRNWIGFLNGSTSIIHTGLFGTIEIELTLANGGVLMQSIKPAFTTYRNKASNVGGNTINLITGTDASLQTTDYTDAIAILSQGTNYTLSDITFNITKYSMPPSFYDAMASVIKSGQLYQIYYPNYSVFQGIPVDNASKNSTTRFSISTKSLDMVIGTFQVDNRDTIGFPMVGGNDYTAYAISPADDSASGTEEGNSISFDGMINTGYPLTFNNSRYFIRNGESIVNCRYLIGGTPLNYENMTEMYNGVLRAFNNSQNDFLGGLYKGCVSINHFRTQFFAHILKLNAQTDNDVYTVSGVNAQENSIDITWETKGGLDVSKFDTRITPTNGKCTPILIACYSSHIDIGANRSIIAYN